MTASTTAFASTRRGASCCAIRVSARSTSRDEYRRRALRSAARGASLTRSAAQFEARARTERLERRAGFVPGELALPDQLIDYTSGRVSSFGGNGAPVTHVDFSEPFSPLLRATLAGAAADCGFSLRAGTYGVTQGPRLETAAEIARLARDGCAMVGMTALPEAALARELGMEYAICALAVNYAAGLAPDGALIGEQIERSMATGMRKVAAVLARFAGTLGPAVV